MTNISLKISSLSPWVGIRNISDYSPFGVLLAERTVEGAFYRNGFNGMEKDDEVKGPKNSYTTEFRQYDSRIGRWLSIDPRYNPTMSPYNGMDNSPIRYNDPSGLYTERRAQRMKSRAEKNGWSTSSINHTGSGKRDYNFNAYKENDNGTGLFFSTMTKGGMRSLKSNSYFESYSGLVSSEIIPARGSSSVSLTIGKNNITIDGLKYLEAIHIANSFNESVAALESYQRDHYEDPFWDKVGYGVNGLVLLAALGPIAEAVGPFIEPISKMALLKTTGSILAQASLNKGDVNLIGALADGFLIFGASQLVGAGFDLNINVVEPIDFEFNTIFNGSISTEQFLTSIVVGSVFDGKIELMKASNIDKKILDIYILFNQSMSKSVEKAVQNGDE